MTLNVYVAEKWTVARLPSPGGDDNQWGGILNDYLSVEHNSDGTLKRASQINAAVDAAQAAQSAVAGKYTKPSSGIPGGDIADAAITASKLSPSLNSAIASGQTAVQSVNGKSGTSVSLSAADVSAISATQLGVAGGAAQLNGSGVLPTSTLPASVVTKSSSAGDTGKAIDAYTGQPLAVPSGRGLATQLSFDPRSKDFDTNGMIWSANNERMFRFYAPWDGAKLVDVSILSATPAGNLYGIVRDEGVAIPGVTYPHSTPSGVGLRTRVWSNSVAFTATAKNWQSLGNPNLIIPDASIPISAGVMIDSTANTGAKIVGKTITDVGAWNLAAADLPHAGGTLPKLMFGAGGVGGSSFVPQDQLTEGTASAGLGTWPLIKLRWV